MAPPSSTEQNEYEALRALNIAKNQALLKELQLNAASAGLGLSTTKKAHSSTSSTKPSHKRKSAPGSATAGREKKAKNDEFVPRRTSSRLAGLQADSEVARQKAEEEHTAIQKAASERRMRVGGDLDLRDIVVPGKKWDRGENFLVDLGVGDTRGPARKYERTFGEDDVKGTDAGHKELKGLREEMMGLRLYEGFEPNRIKITPERIYSLAFHPTEAKSLIFAGDKLGNLGIFDASQTTGSSALKPDDKPAVKQEDLQPTPPPEEDSEEDEDEDPDPIITAFHLHSRTITTLHFPTALPTSLYTSSYDSSIRSLDLTLQKSTELYTPADRTTDEPISGLDLPTDDSSPHILFFSTLSGTVSRHDTRIATTSPSSSSTTTWTLSDKKIGGFSLCPRAPHLLATASLDRTLKLWDLRKMVGPAAEKHPSLLGEHESRLSVSHASFNAAGQIATSSYDDTVKVYDVSSAIGWKKEGRCEDESVMEPTAVIPHNNQTGRWVTILRAQWQFAPPTYSSLPRFVIGNMSRFVDIYTATGQQLAQLGGDGITAVPAVAQFHPSRNWVAGGTASGKLCLWM
ncbi:MAG: hypothetical protein M1817_006790 [Caeruleum heppii]|nr:MAG: hypothetical protein M1817_006790 [Caeruleum heppii]